MRSRHAIAVTAIILTGSVATARAAEMRGTIVADPKGSQPVSGFDARVFKSPVSGELLFRIRPPDGFKAGAETRYPLLVYLHGRGSRGTDNLKQMKLAPGHFADGDKTFLKTHPCFIVAPQTAGPWCSRADDDTPIDTVPPRPAGRMVVELVEKLVADGRVDPNRLYITGLSMGGWGLTDVIRRRPNLFARALLCTGGMHPSAPAKLKPIAIWWFMGAKDGDLPASARRRVADCKAAGADITYTEIKGGNHASSWERAYGDPKVWDWLFAKPLPAVRAGRPEFSWKTVPLYMHFGKSAGPLTEQELRFVARASNFVCFEKGHGVGRFGSTEKGIAHDARRLKALNPKIKVLFYWNGFLNYRLYDACKEFTEHPDWVFRDKAGKPIYKGRTLEQYNVLNAGFRQWWASIAGKAVGEYGCDGVFMDALLQPTRPVWIKRGWGKGSEQRVTGAVIDMMQRARTAMGPCAVLLYNGLRSSDRAGAMGGGEFLAHADGTTVEHFGAFASRTMESIARDIEAIGQAGKAGKIVVVKGWPDPEFNWQNTTKMKLPPAKLAAEAREKIAFPLACFLVAAQRDAYFCYSWGYREKHGSLVDYPQLHKPLGEPKADAVRNGWTYTRSFQHVEVWVDLSKRTARLEWRP